MIACFRAWFRTSIWLCSGTMTWFLGIVSKFYNGVREISNIASPHLYMNKAQNESVLPRDWCGGRDLSDNLLVYYEDSDPHPP
jgi:hypothetical protein